MVKDNVDFLTKGIIKIFLVRGPLFYFVVFLTAYRSFPEFAGSSGKVFPGQESPRTPRILPREVQLPKWFKNDLIEIKLVKKHLQRIQGSGLLASDMDKGSAYDISYFCENEQTQQRSHGMSEVEC